MSLEDTEAPADQDFGGPWGKKALDGKRREKFAEFGERAATLLARHAHATSAQAIERADADLRHDLGTMARSLGLLPEVTK